MTGVVEAGELRAVARAGDGCDRLGAAAVNDDGDIAFVAERAGAQEIVCRSETLLRAGNRFAEFRELDLGAGGQLTFLARLADGTGEGVFLLTPQGIRPVAITGGRSPNGHRYRTFAALTMASTVLESGPYHRIAFLAGLADGRRSLVIVPSYTGPAEVLTTGDRLGDGIVERLAISRVGFSVGCVATVRRAGRLLRTVVIAHEGALAWPDGDGAGGSPATTRTLAPPGCHLEIAFTSVRLAGGQGALLARPVLENAEILARTGDPAPGLPGVRLARFGPPVASSGLPMRMPFGVASPVRLSDGRRAVWLATLAAATPLAGHAILPVLDGDRASGLPVRGPAPVALTNTGTLLVRASLDGRPALLALDGLLPGRVPAG
jgi:hypothetical protein